MRALTLLALFCWASAILTHGLAQSCNTYIVKAGDICWDIAQAHGITVAQLESWNPNVQCSNLQIGEVLCVSDPGGSPPAESCTTYTVKAGDICWDIAQAHGITVAELEQWNSGLQCSNLQIGQVLCVSNPGGGSPPAAACRTYVVKAGDICWDIAQANGITVAQLESWNPNVQCSNLQIGEVLCVSDPGSSPPAESCRTYTVKAGDICWDIAQAHGITVAELEEWNPGVQCSNLQIGQVLCVSNPGGVPSPSPPPPPPSPTGDCIQYAVKAGDSCWAIAVEHGISLAEFQIWNPNVVCSNLRIGQLVCVSEPGSVTPAPPPPPAEYNGNVFTSYIGALYNGVRFSNVPINRNVKFYFILAFAIDYSNMIPSDGVFNIHWQNGVLTPSAVEAIKAEYSNVKVMLSLGGDTINGQPVYFSPVTVESWVSNAVNSLTRLIEEYHLDGIDINYEHFPTSVSPEMFATCIGQLITQLKQRGLISVTSIAPFDRLESQYLTLWEEHSNLIDYVNFQFYTYHIETTAEEYVNLYMVAAAKYGGGSKVLASYNTGPNIGPPPATVLTACRLLQSNGRLPGIFVWSADGSFQYTGFGYDREAQELLAGSWAGKEDQEARLHSVA